MLLTRIVLNLLFIYQDKTYSSFSLNDNFTNILSQLFCCDTNELAPETVALCKQ